MEHGDANRNISETAMEITMDSRIKNVWAHPVGHDVLQKILLTMGISQGAVDNPVTGNLTLRSLAGLSGKRLGEDFWDTFLHLLNSEKGRPDESPCGIQAKWWKKAVFYQIYPRSFCDGNGDGTGDFQGILEKVDYLKNLGVDAVWLSPVYDSPNDDNGYDIRDYYSVMKEFGTMEEFDRILEALHDRGMKLVMDLVINHTSDEHAWFREALRNPESQYHEYYFFKKGEGDKAPNNWTSFFSGSAWNYYEEQQEWALHLFSKKQMDLNWENPSVREDIIRMIRWWLDKGVDGFRMDVINYISKEPGLADGNGQIGELLGYYGVEHYFYGPRLHEYLKEIREKAFAPYDAFAVGETPGVGMEMSKLLTGEDRKELDMVFSFDHLETPGHVRFDDYRYDLNYLKQYYMDWMEHYGNRCWMSLFYDNHDNPRMVSKVNPDPAYREVLAKLLGAIQFTLRGTPFLYQGQEIGMGNVDFQSIDQIQDVESRNLYEELTRTMTAEEAFRKVAAGTRDHARVMMKWDEVCGQKKDRESVYYFYKKLIALRKKYPALVYGDVIFTNRRRKNVFSYIRRGGGMEFYVECNLSEKEVMRGRHPEGLKGVLSNYEKHGRRMQAYEVCIYRK